MIYGLDTTVLVQLELADHEMHARAARLRDRLLGEGCSFALAPQVLAEFVHIVSDSRRFVNPAPVPRALEQSERWWNAEEITRVFPGPDAVSTFHRWMRDAELGRNRILDTLLAATYSAAGITAVVTSNFRDYRSFMEVVVTP
ncbi:MAG: hypothetical protein ACOCW6_01305 [Spirochaetota bacterium]